LATQLEAAAHVDLGDRRFRELIDDGVLQRSPPGEYVLEHVRIAYIRHLRKMAAGRGTKTDADLATERALLAREQRDTAALKNATARGELVSIEEVGRQVEVEYGVVRQRLLAIPGSIAEALGSMSNREEREAAIATAIIEALSELHNPRSIDANRPNGTGAAPSPGATGAQATATT
jgi:phage terminase Nu1 subunit (DNA packaging protein)